MGQVPGDRSGETYRPVQDLKRFKGHILDASDLKLAVQEHFDSFDVPVYPKPISVKMPEGWFMGEGIRKRLQPLHRTLAFFFMEELG